MRKPREKRGVQANARPLYRFFELRGDTGDLARGSPWATGEDGDATHRVPNPEGKRKHRRVMG